jgi:hypothetical protein
MRTRIGILLSLLCLVLLLQGCATVVREAREGYMQVKSAISTSEIQITLDNSFIHTYKDRATIDVMFTVDKTSKRAKPAFLDGDFHIAGRAPEIGLPVVAEIENSAFEREALDMIHRFEGTGEPIRISGAWRIWPEHVGSAEEVQGEELPGFDITNPDHVFEIHPVTYVKDKSTLNSFRPVEGYSPGRANTVFQSYKNAKCRIMPEDKTTTIVTRKGAFNDVEFIMEIVDGRQDIVADGRFVNAEVYDLKGERLVQRVRMVFVKDTPPEKIVRSLRRGDRLHVFGLPRIDLSAVAWRANHSRDNPEILYLNLPYEIIVVGVYKD